MALKTDTGLKGFWYRMGKNVKVQNGEAHWRMEQDKDANKMFSMRANMDYKDLAVAGALIYRHNDNSLRKYDLNMNYKVNDNLKVGVKHVTPVT